MKVQKEKSLPDICSLRYLFAKQMSAHMLKAFWVGRLEALIFGGLAERAGYLWSSYKGHVGDVLALEGDEGRGSLR